MSEQEPIHHREPGHNNHPGQHSHRRRLDASASALIGFADGVRIRAIQKVLDSIRRERIDAHEQGHKPDDFKDMGFVGGFYPEGRGTEIELFPGVYTGETPYTPTDLNDPPEFD